MAEVSRQISFEHGGERYPVALTVNALCVLEEEFGGRSITDVGEDIASGRAGAKGVRSLFRVALLEGHPEITAVEAGRLAGELGAAKTSELIQEAFEKLQDGLGEEPDLPKVDKRGRLTLEVGEDRIMLVFAMNAQAELEEYFDGLQPEEIARKIAKREISLRDLRAMLRASLVDDRDLTTKQAGDMIDRLGLRVAGTAIAEAFVAAFPETAKDMVDEDEAPKGNRRQRRSARKHPTRKPPKGGTGKP